MKSRHLAPLTCLFLLLACVDRRVPEGIGETGELPGEESRPIDGQLYSSCHSAGECDIGLNCFFPAGESGYCTQACGSDPICRAHPGTEELGSCVGVSDSSASVCAISCESNRCPFGMRCETVEVDGGGARLCF